MVPRRDLISDIVELVELIQKDDAATRATLALLRNGHPQAAKFDHGYKEGLADGPGPHLYDPNETPEGPPSYPDPTGEQAIRPDEGARRLGQYREHLRRAHFHIEQLDIIRRFAKPDFHEASKQAEPDDWCKNCLPYGFCAPRNNDRDHYCRWCRTTRAEFKFLPKQKAVEFHHNGEHAKAYAQMQADKRARK